MLMNSKVAVPAKTLDGQPSALIPHLKKSLWSPPSGELFAEIYRDL